MECYIKKYRKQAKLTQRELADMVNVRRETIIRLESGQYNPSVELAIVIAKTLNVAVEDIFCVDRKMFPMTVENRFSKNAQ